MYISIPCCQRHAVGPEKEQLMHFCGGGGSAVPIVAGDSPHPKPASATAASASFCMTTATAAAAVTAPACCYCHRLGRHPNPHVLIHPGDSEFNPGFGKVRYWPLRLSLSGQIRQFRYPVPRQVAGNPFFLVHYHRLMGSSGRQLGSKALPSIDLLGLSMLKVPTYWGGQTNTNPHLPRSAVNL